MFHQAALRDILNIVISLLIEIAPQTARFVVPKVWPDKSNQVAHIYLRVDDFIEESTTMSDEDLDRCIDQIYEEIRVLDFFMFESRDIECLVAQGRINLVCKRWPKLIPILDITHNLYIVEYHCEYSINSQINQVIELSKATPSIVDKAFTYDEGELDEIDENDLDEIDVAITSTASVIDSEVISVDRFMLFESDRNTIAIRADAIGNIELARHLAPDDPVDLISVLKDDYRHFDLIYGSTAGFDLLNTNAIDVIRQLNEIDIYGIFAYQEDCHEVTAAWICDSIIRLAERGQTVHWAKDLLPSIVPDTVAIYLLIVDDIDTYVMDIEEISPLCYHYYEERCEYTLVEKIIDFDIILKMRQLGQQDRLHQLLARYPNLEDEIVQ